MQKWIATIAYQGGAYVGWQKQIHQKSIQACVETALSIIANEEITVICAGRTDSGVHAHQQFVHFYLFALYPIYGYHLA